MRLSQFDLIVFDLDGTLVDSARDIAAAANHTRMQLGLESLPLETIKNYVGKGVVKLLQNVFETEDEKLIDEALERYMAYYNDHLLDSTCLYPGVERLLNTLQSKSLSVLTNKPSHFSDKILSGLNVRHFFRHVIGGDSPMGRKPDPAALHWLMKECGVAPEKTCLIGDSPVDAETGSNAGVFTVLLSQGFVSEKELQAFTPGVLLKNVSALHDWSN